MEFKTERIKKEYGLLDSKNIGIKTLFLDVDDYCFKKYNKHIVLTGILRTNEEQKQIYGQETKKVSPHQLWDAGDLRSSIFSETEIKDIVDYINIKYNKKNRYKWTALCHEVNGFGMHFHIQFRPV